MEVFIFFPFFNDWSRTWLRIHWECVCLFLQLEIYVLPSCVLRWPECSHWREFIGAWCKIWDTSLCTSVNVYSCLSVCAETLALQNGRYVEGLPNTGNVLYYKVVHLIQRVEMHKAGHSQLFVCLWFFFLNPVFSQGSCSHFWVTAITWWRLAYPSFETCMSAAHSVSWGS